MKKEKKYEKDSKKIYLKNKNIFAMLLLIILVCLIVIPYLLIFLKSFGISITGGSFTLDIYRRTLMNKQTMIALKNTLYVAVSVTIFTTFLGGSLAWLMTRTDFPNKKIINNLVFLNFTIPSYILGVSWIQILGRNGFINNLSKTILNIENYNFNVYSLEAFIIVMTIHLYPLLFMAISNALKKTNTSFENAAILSGASKWKVISSITIPLIRPTIFSMGLFIFSRTMANFGVASVLVLPSGNELLTTHIETALNDLDLSMATVISILLVIISGTIFFVNDFIISKKSYTNITINSSKPKLIKLGKWKKVIVFVVYSIQFMTTIIPLFSIIIASFLKRWGLPISLNNLTFDNYISVLFKNDMTIRAFKNSFLYGGVAATIAAILGVSIAYISNYKKTKLGKNLEFIASLPMGIPNVVIAIAAILAWINKPFKLYGTFWIIIITYIPLFLPLIIKNVSGLLKNQDVNLENAGRMQGATEFRTFKDLMLPMISSGIEAGWLYAFLIAFREIPISLFLNSPGTETVGVLLFNLRSDSGGMEIISTVSILVIFITIIGRLGVKYIRKNRKKSVFSKLETEEI